MARFHLLLFALNCAAMAPKKKVKKKVHRKALKKPAMTTDSYSLQKLSTNGKLPVEYLPPFAAKFVNFVPDLSFDDVPHRFVGFELLEVRF